MFGSSQWLCWLHSHDVLQFFPVQPNEQLQLFGAIHLPFTQPSLQTGKHCTFLKRMYVWSLRMPRTMNIFFCPNSRKSGRMRYYMVSIKHPFFWHYSTNYWHSLVFLVIFGGYVLLYWDLGLSDTSILIKQTGKKES